MNMASNRVSLTHHIDTDRTCGRTATLMPGQLVLGVMATILAVRGSLAILGGHSPGAPPEVTEILPLVVPVLAWINSNVAIAWDPAILKIPPFPEADRAKVRVAVVAAA